MTETKFTPGPWKFEVDEECVSAKSETWEICCFGDRCDEYTPDARLIAAAPEMFEALEAMRDEIGRMKPTPSLVAVALMADAALAKARGEP